MAPAPPKSGQLCTEPGNRQAALTTAMARRNGRRTASAEAEAGLPPLFRDWFVGRGWTPRQHQLQLLANAQKGLSTLLIAPTGAGKTLAGFLPSLVSLSEGAAKARSIHTLYVSPLKALAVDIARNVEAPVAEMGLKHPPGDAHGRHAAA